MRILLVEDDEIDARQVIRITTPGHSVVWANSLSCAMNKARGDTFDVVLLDLALHDSFGLATLDAMDRACPTVPVVVLTGNDESDADAALRAGAQDYLSKSNLDGSDLDRALRYAVDRKKIENQLKSTNDQLERTLEQLRGTQSEVIQKERLSALGQMASGIAHDFNNFLSPILGHVDFLLSFPETLANEDELLDVLESIKVSAVDAGLVVGRLKAFYSPGEKEIEQSVVDLGHVVESAVKLTQAKWRNDAQRHGKTIDIDVDCAPDVLIWANQIEIKEILANLIINAVDAIEQEGMIRILLCKDEGTATLAVQDNGVGMADEVMENCFNPFFTTKGEVGTGLGLAMVKGNVERNSGTIDVNSEPGEGTTFRLTFPLTDQVKVSGPVDSIPEAWLGEVQCSVLVVDDEPAIRGILKRTLKKLGHKVTEAIDGESALQALGDTKYDLVVTDCVMPRMNGIALSREITKRLPGVPVIMLTGYGEPMADGERLPVNVTAVLTKPFQIDELRVAIEDAIRGLMPEEISGRAN